MRRFRGLLLVAILLAGLFPAAAQQVIVVPPSGSVAATVTVTEVDGSPSVAVGTLKFSNGSVTNNGDGSATITTGGTGSGHTIQNEGSPLTQRPGLNFLGTAVDCADDAANNRTNCTVTTAGGGLTASGPPSSGQVAEFTSATNLQGVGTTGTGTYAKAVSPVFTTPFIGGVNPQTGTTYTMVAADNHRLVTFSNASPVAVTLPVATTTGFTDKAVFPVRNVGTGVVTITPTTSTIDGASTLVLGSQESAVIYSNGVNYITQRGGSPDRVSGVTFPANPATDGVPVVVATNTINYKVLPLCLDTAGNHLNYDTSTHNWICGTSTGVAPAAVNHGDAPNIGVANHATTTEVRVDELSSASVNLDAPLPLGTALEGQRLRYNLFSTVSRLLTYTQTTGGFAANSGQPLPSRTIAGAYLLLEFRWTARAANPRWELVYVSWRLPKVTPFGDVASIGINANTTELAAVALGASTQTTYTFSNPTGTLVDGQVLRIRITTNAGAPAKPLAWGSMYTGNAGLSLPTVTTGNGTQDNFGYSYNAADNTFVLLATSQASLTARRRTCVISVERGGTALVDADIPIRRRCTIPTNAAIEEISVIAESSGTPAVSVHRTPAVFAATALLSSPLTTGASGALACARTTAIAGFSGVTCSATLVGTNTTGEVFLGLTSGTASTNSTDILVTIHYLLNS